LFLAAPTTAATATATEALTAALFQLPISD
jgi:hypothetical protein